MRSSTILLALAIGGGLSVNAAEIVPANRFGSPHQSTASRVPLLPGPYLLSPAGTPSLNGHTWKALRFERGQLSLKANAASGDTKPRREAPPSGHPAPAPRPETLRFDETLPKLNTSLPAAPAKPSGL